MYHYRDIVGLVLCKNLFAKKYNNRKQSSSTTDIVELETFRSDACHVLNVTLLFLGADILLLKLTFK